MNEGKDATRTGGKEDRKQRKLQSTSLYSKMGRLFRGGFPMEDPPLSFHRAQASQRTATRDQHLHSATSNTQTSAGHHLHIR